MRLHLIALPALLFALSACQQVTPRGNVQASAGGLDVVRQFLATESPLAPYQTGTPYEVEGTRYVPAEDFSYNQVGKASFYSNALNGALTASGETYSSGLMTASHRTLPFQTIVRVTNTSNRRSVIVRINDRGPFVGDRLIDVSEKAATDLGMVRAGEARVRVEVLAGETRAFESGLSNGRVLPGEETQAIPAQPEATPEPQPAAETSNDSGEGAIVAVQDDNTVQPASQAATGGFYVLAGTYTSQSDAQAIQQRMASLGNATIEEASGVHKVYIGPLGSRLDAQAMLGRVFAQGATNASIVQR